MSNHATVALNQGATHRNTEPSSILSPSLRMTTIGIVSLVALIAFETLAVTTAMPAVASALGGLSLYGFAFGITLAASVVSMTIAGGWSDHRGPAAPLWSGMACFLLGLVLAGSAQTMPMFLTGRLLQGLGAGGVSVALYVLVGRRYPEALRRRIFAAFATAWVLPSLAGPLLSGLVVEHIGWRWVFLGIPFLAIPAAAMLRSALRDLPGLTKGKPGSWHRYLHALGAATGVSFLYVGGQAHGVSASAILISATALSLLCTWKLLPPGTLFAARGLPSVIALRGLIFSAFFGTEAYLPLLLTQERGFTAPMAGLVLSTGALGWCGASWYQGHSQNGWSRHLFLRVGTSAVCLGLCITFSIVWPVVPVEMAVLGWTLTGMGMGLISASLSLLTLSMSQPDQQGANSSALQLCEAIVVATTLAIGASIFSGLMKTAPRSAFMGIFSITGFMAILAALVVGRTNVKGVFIK